MTGEQFAHMSTDDLRTMLSDVIREVDRNGPEISDAAFVRALANEIAQREKDGDKEVEP